MKKCVILFCVLIIPLTLASDTQHRFRVYVDVGGGDDQAVSTIESHLKRELRLLGDVDVVGEDEGWKYIMRVKSLAMEYKDGRKSGYFAIAESSGWRFHQVSPDYRDPPSRLWIPTILNELSAAYYPREALPEYCINYVNLFDKDLLARARKTLRERN